MAETNDDTSAAFHPSGPQSAWIDTFSSLDPKAYLDGFLSKNVRHDGRLRTSCRPTTIMTHVLTRNTAGSALVKLGDTQVLAAVSLLVGQPAAGYGTLGDLVVSISSSSSQQKSAASNYAVSSSWLQRVLIDSDWIDFSKLCIVEGKAAWRLQVTVFVLCNDGNVADATLLAAVAALTDTSLPATSIDPKGVVSVVESEKRTPLPLDENRIPVPLTVGWYAFDNDVDGETSSLQLLVDPSEMEAQHRVDTCITVVVTCDTNKILNVNQTGLYPLSTQQLARVVQMAFGRARELKPLLVRA